MSYCYKPVGILSVYHCDNNMTITLNFFCTYRNKCVIYYVSRLIFRLFSKWIKGQERPPNGSLVQLNTKESKTTLEFE